MKDWPSEERKKSTAEKDAKALENINKSDIGLILIRQDFDRLENSIRAAIVEEPITTFVGKSSKSASNLANEYLDDEGFKSKIVYYLGWDNRVYPIFYLRETELHE